MHLSDMTFLHVQLIRPEIAVKLRRKGWKIDKKKVRRSGAVTGNKGREKESEKRQVKTLID